MNKSHRNYPIKAYDFDNKFSFDDLNNNVSENRMSTNEGIKGNFIYKNGSKFRCVSYDRKFNKDIVNVPFIIPSNEKIFIF